MAMLGCVIGLVYVATTRWREILPAQLDRVKDAVQGKCEVVLRHKHLADLGNTAEQRCTEATVCDEMVWNKKQWERIWDGDRGLKVVSNMTYLAGAVDCPCVEPGPQAGNGGTHPHQDAPALILMRSESLQTVPWISCVHVRWFRGSEKGSSEAPISTRIVAAGSRIAISKWIELGEIDCFKIAAKGVWNYDELYVNANKDGYIQFIENWKGVASIFYGILGCCSVAFLFTGICCCMFARKCTAAAP
eukprot:gnl/TRDRNA2_/TRDRNA2_74234_c0_seq1.p1 gnl/TRDRNA2_/TRDRNA2_74234_c0~~gnl/TRDRNA2_/TRDRNA2_74234_c0_seq1.p1  ORF type:complete len:255 (+),score=29.16 gnl/TRDRNA2_/TRDRNA2_74234_c0_seq1:26-766(+)